MKLTTLGWVVNSLKHMEHKITVREDIRQRAVKALQRMLDIK
jgi:quinolinate synthase